MSSFLVISTVFLFVVILTIVKGVRIVPEGYRDVVERLGKYQTTLEPGLCFIVPFIDSVKERLTTKDIILPIPSQEIITGDNVIIETGSVAYYTVLDPKLAIYGVTNYRLAIETLVQTALRSLIGELKLDEALASRNEIKVKLVAAISGDLSEWGIKIKNLEIQDIVPSQTMQLAMEEQAAAERERRAQVIRADGEKASAILSAEGRLESAKRDAEATILLADASKEAIEKVAKATGDNQFPAMFILGEKYIESLKDMSTSDNAKTIFLPADLPGAVKGMLGSISLLKDD